MDIISLHEGVGCALGLACGWPAAAFVWTAGGYLWWRAVRRLAAKPPLPMGDGGRAPRPSVPDVAQPPPAVRDEESAPARAPVPHTQVPAPVVPPRAHAGSAVFAAGAGLLLVAVGARSSRSAGRRTTR